MTDHKQWVATYIDLFSELPIPISIASLEKSGEVFFVNRALTEAFGYTLEDLPNLDEFARLALPKGPSRLEAMAWWTEALTQAIQQGAPAKPKEFLLIDRWGQDRQLVVHPTVTHGLVISAFQDKTEQRSTERALESAEQRLKEEAYLLTENIPVGTYTMVLEPGADLANFRFMSTRFLELTGLSREEAESDPLKGFACVHPDDYDEWVALNAKTFAERVPFYGETRVIVDGEVRWISAESIPRELDDGTVVWEGVLMDLSRQKKAEASAKAMQEELLQSTARQSRLQEREALLQDMHDGFGSQLIIAKQALEHGTLDQNALSELLDQCLADLHLLADTLEITGSSLNQALANFRHRTRQRLQATGIAIHWDVALERCPAFSSRQQVQVMRIIQEALTNALRHANANNISIGARCDPHRYLHIEVIDDGVGFGEPLRAGRGLANMKKRAAELGGELSIEPNTPGTAVKLTIQPPATSE